MVAVGKHEKRVKLDQVSRNIRCNEDIKNAGPISKELGIGE